MALKGKDSNCIQVPINFSKILEKVRFRVGPDGWSGAGSGSDSEFEPVKKKRSLQLKKACGTREKPKCVPAGSGKESKEKGRRFEAANPEMLASLAKPYGPKLNTQWVINNLRDWWTA